MIALTSHQPHAWLLASGIKIIEVRPWKTEYRGTLLIHAGKKYDPNVKVSIDYQKASIHGAFIGFGYLTKIFVFQNKKHFEATKMEHMNIPVDEYWNPDVTQYGWVIKCAEQFETPIPCRGMKKLWYPSKEIKKQCLEQIGIIKTRGAR